MEKGKNPARPILLVEDEPHTLQSFEVVLRSAGIDNIIQCQDSREVLSILEDRQIEVVCLDLIMPHVSGQELLGAITEEYPDIPVIMVTGVNEVETVVQCMKQGAFDYILKPIETDRLISSVLRAMEIRELKRENSKLKRRFLDDTLEHPEAFTGIITRNKKMRSVFHYCEAISEGNFPALITGETGVGKELIAGVLHKLSGRRGEFVAVNIAGLDDNVFSDTLFGHTRGAFTGADRPRKGLVETAAGGTLFLDEIGDLSQASQVKLLRLLDQREFYPVGSDMAKPAAARILFATFRPLDELEKSGQIRKDLYYRLRSHHIHLPPLRERLEDIPLLLEHFLELAAAEFDKNKPAYHEELITLLQSYHFSGNIRELKAMVMDAVSSYKGRMLSMNVFKERIFGDGKKVESAARQFPQAGEYWVSCLEHLPTLKEATTSLVGEAMRRADNNQRIAAMMLGISPQALNQRLKRHER
ncbi:MAG: sigma-54-dependent Fis family transcriptional regulator [Candidatus Glassbacteria bacterium]|nr:sigma-54-dependent Fis family transcriptional regulator [Candidatus Glassbacteria bacterium]